MNKLITKKILLLIVLILIIILFFSQGLYPLVFNLIFFFIILFIAFVLSIFSPKIGEFSKDKLSFCVYNYRSNPVWLSLVSIEKISSVPSFPVKGNIKSYATMLPIWNPMLMFITKNDFYYLPITHNIKKQEKVLNILKILNNVPVDESVEKYFDALFIQKIKLNIEKTNYGYFINKEDYLKEFKKQAIVIFISFFLIIIITAFIYFANS